MEPARSTVGESGSHSAPSPTEFLQLPGHQVAHGEDGFWASTGTAASGGPTGPSEVLESYDPLGSRETIIQHPPEVISAYEEVYGESPFGGLREIPSTDPGDAATGDLEYHASDDEEDPYPM